MIPNVLNAMLGIWLVYVAILDPAWADRTALLGLAAVVVAACAAWARASDFAHWQSNTNIVLALVLLALAALQAAGVVVPVLRFWGLLWIGILVAILALWAALYRPTAAPAHR